MSAPTEVYDSAFAIFRQNGIELDRRVAAAVAIGLDHAWDAAVDRVKAVVDGAVLQAGQDGTAADMVVIPVTEIERALGIR